MPILADCAGAGDDVTITATAKSSSHIQTFFISFSFRKALRSDPLRRLAFTAGQPKSGVTPNISACSQPETFRTAFTNGSTKMLWAKELKRAVVFGALAWG